MKILVRLYPRAWRERYEREFLALLEDSGVSLRDAIDIVGGGVVARLRPQVGTPLLVTDTANHGIYSMFRGLRFVAACLAALGLVLFTKGPTPWAAASYSDGAPQQPDHPIYLRSVPAADVLDYAFGRVFHSVPVTRAMAVHVGTTMASSHITIRIKEVLLAQVYESDNLTRCTAARSPRTHILQTCPPSMNGHVYWVLHVVEQSPPSRNPAQLIFVDAYTCRIASMSL